VLVLFYKGKLRYEITREIWCDTSGKIVKVVEENLIHKISVIADTIVELVEDGTKKKLIKATIDLIPD
jgi:hypothetical protein